MSEAYGDRAGATAPRRRLLLGAALFASGTLLVLVGIAAATTDLAGGANGNLTAARRYGGVLGGVGVPAVLLGVSAVLPASRRTRIAAVAGAGVAALGVALFARAYPCQWSGSNCGAGLPDLTLPTVSVYFLGVTATLWCLFVGVATFKRRNDPGGTATVEVTRRGETRVVEVPATVPGLGGVGLLGGAPDGGVSTQTNRGDDRTLSDGGSTAGGGGRKDTGSGTSPAPSNRPEPTVADGRDAEFVDAGDDRPDGEGDGLGGDPADVYCGTCSAFRYVRTGDGMVPYCDRREEAMADMNACEDWSSR